MSFPSSRRSQVEAGCEVVVEFLYEGGERETQTLSLVADESADFTQGLMGVGSALAKALMGYSEGERVFYRQADLLEVHILKITPGGARSADGVAERRQEAQRKAARQAELGNAISFAASFNGKWGDYDPSALTEEWEKDDELRSEDDQEGPSNVQA
jgi:hypothetical protein